MGARKILFNPSRRLYKIYRIVIMFLDPCCHSQYIRVENDIMRIESYLIYKQMIGPFANFYFTGGCISLPFLIKSHHYHSRTILANRTSMFKEFLLSLFQRDGIHN